MKNFLTTTALGIVLLASTANADMLTAETTYQTQTGDIRASELIGSSIYATENQVSNESTMKAGDEKNWDNIGEVNDVILNKNGEVEAVVIGVGGFLGIGEKDVAVSMGDLTFISDGEDADDYFVVVNASKQVLTDAPAYKAPENGQAKADNMKQAKADNMNNDNMAPNQSTLKRPEVTVDGYVTTTPADLTADALEGATVYGTDGKDVGEVSNLVLGDDGKTVEKLVIDVGGFLGMGEHRIAVGIDEANIQKSSDGSELRVYVDDDKKTLENMPEYKS